MMSIQNRNLSIGDGGDDAVRVALGWSMFTDLGGAWSLDVKLGRRPYARVFALGARMIQWQLALCYFGAVTSRFAAPGSTATRCIRRCSSPSSRVRSATRCSRIPACASCSRTRRLATELALPILILTWWQAPRARGLAVLASTALQIGILLMMRVGIFTPP